MDRSYRRRIASEWRGAVVVAVAAVALALLGRSPGFTGGGWLLLGLAALIVLVAIGLLGRAYFRPVPLPAASTRWRYRDLGVAQKQVSRGKPVDPPELQAAAIDGARGGLRVTHLNVGWWPVTGGFLSLRIGEGGFNGGFGYFGAVLMLAGVSGLGWSGVVQGRLDRLEDASDTTFPPAPATATEEADGDRT